MQALVAGLSLRKYQVRFVIEGQGVDWCWSVHNLEGILSPCLDQFWPGESESWPAGL